MSREADIRAWLKGNRFFLVRKEPGKGCTHAYSSCPGTQPIDTALVTMGNGLAWGYKPPASADEAVARFGEQLASEGFKGRATVLVEVRVLAYAAGAVIEEQDDVSFVREARVVTPVAALPERAGEAVHGGMRVYRR